MFHSPFVSICSVCLLLFWRDCVYSGQLCLSERLLLLLLLLLLYRRHHYQRISHFSALAGKYSPILGCGNQQD